MKKIYWVVALLFVFVGILSLLNDEPVDFKSNPQVGIQFHHGTLKEAILQARNQQKLIFIDVYATWCGPCKKLKSKTFTDAKLGEYFNEHFICVALDGEEPEGSAFVKSYEISSYPTMIFINHDGVEIRRIIGYQTAKQLLKIAQEISIK